MLRVLCCIRSLTRRYRAAPRHSLAQMRSSGRLRLACLGVRYGSRAASQTARAACTASHQAPTASPVVVPEPEPEPYYEIIDPVPNEPPTATPTSAQPLPRRPRLPIFRPPRPPPHPLPHRVHPQRRHRRPRLRPLQNVLWRPQIRAWVSRVILTQICEFCDEGECFVGDCFCGSLSRPWRLLSRSARPARRPNAVWAAAFATTLCRQWRLLSRCLRSLRRVRRLWRQDDHHCWPPPRHRAPITRLRTFTITITMVIAMCVCAHLLSHFTHLQSKAAARIDGCFPATPAPASVCVCV